MSCPAGHKSQTIAPLSANVARSQVKHVVLSLAPRIKLAVPAGHSSHEAERLLDQVPGGQGKHTTEPSPEVEPAGQLAHSLAFIAPNLIPNEPPGHGEHWAREDSPVTSL